MLVQFILYVLCISARHLDYKRTLVSSADDERGAPPMVAGHIDGLLGSMPHNWSGLSG